MTTGVCIRNLRLINDSVLVFLVNQRNYWSGHPRIWFLLLDPFFTFFSFVEIQSKCDFCHLFPQYYIFSWKSFPWFSWKSLHKLILKSPWAELKQTKWFWIIIEIFIWHKFWYAIAKRTINLFVHICHCFSVLGLKFHSCIKDWLSKVDILLLPTSYPFLSRTKCGVSTFSTSYIIFVIAILSRPVCFFVWFIAKCFLRLFGQEILKYRSVFL